MDSRPVSDGSRKLVDIVYVCSHSAIFETRTTKIVRSLSKRYTLLVLGWNREGLLKEQFDNTTVDFRMLNVRAPYGQRALVRFFPLFWFWIFTKLIVYRPSIVHANDLDTVIPCYIYKVIFRKKLLFDVHDRYAMLNISVKCKRLFSIVHGLEELFSGRSDVLVTVTEKLLTTFKKRPARCEVIMNCSDDLGGRSLKSQNNVLSLVYIGPIVKGHGVERIAAVIKDVDGVELVIAGRIIDEEVLNKMLEVPIVKYKGHLLPAEAVSLAASSDVMIALYDLRARTQTVFAMPNKLWEALMCGIPIITNVASELVNRVNCGIIVNYDDSTQIKEAVVLLRDNKELRLRMGSNGRKAFLQDYNWNLMEKKWYEIYDKLLKK